MLCNGTYFIFFLGALSHVLQAKDIMVEWRCHQFMYGFLANDYLSRVSRQSANGKGDNERIPGTGHKSLGIFRMAEETPRKPQL